jgi:hypothetical protein
MDTVRVFLYRRKKTVCSDKQQIVQGDAGTFELRKFYSLERNTRELRLITVSPQFVLHYDCHENLS